ncbi:MAG: sugar phosphate isomerase/epimerase [Actinobacteria bacterium]|nr:sugar phosphate isomerase/epimerase [Actinomycetota bacterium]
MRIQNYQLKDKEIKEKFLEIKAKSPEAFKNRIKFSWSNWGFGVESLGETAKRLNKYDIRYIELHGNRYGKDLGYKESEVKKILSEYNIEVAGVCGMFSADNDLSSNRPVIRQNAIDYIRRNLELAAEVGARYFLIVPGAVGRPNPYDDMESYRSVETLKVVADKFCDAGIRGAVEPIRSAEVSFCHTFSDAKEYINAVASQGVKHINGDVYHMLVEESHIGMAIIDAKGMLTNLHMADTNRDALGEGSLDLDTIIMALYVIGYNNDESCFVTPEPLGPGGDPYPAMYGKPDKEKLDNLVKQTISCFREREEEVLSQ